MPCLRATIAADTPGSMPSATILCFCSAVQRRRLPQCSPRCPGAERSYDQSYEHPPSAKRASPCRPLPSPTTSGTKPPAPSNVTLRPRLLTASISSMTSITPTTKRAVLSPTHYDRVSNERTLGAISATLIVILAIAQGSGRLHRPMPPSFLLTIWRTIAVARDQSASLGSSAMREHSDSAEHFHFDDVS